MPWTLVVVLIILVPIAAIHYYVWRKVLGALSELTSWDRVTLRRIAAGLHLWTISLPLAYMISYVVVGRRVLPMFGGDSLAVDLIFSYPFWFALVIVFQLFLLFAFLDILDFTFLRFVPVAKVWLHRQRSRIHVALVILITVYSCITIARNTWTVRIAEHDIALSSQYRAFNKFRIALISDVQGDGRTTANDLRSYVAKVNALHPDVVFFGGDLVTWGTGYIDSTAEILGELRSRYGTVAAVGDHDMFSDKGWVLAALARNGIRIVEDSTISLNVEGSKMALSVVTYTYLQRPSKGKLEKLIDGTNEAFKVFLVHQPAEELIQFAQDRGFNLFLAGHTHGGGIAIGIPGLFLFAPANLETKYLSGLYHSGRMAVCVTNGLGLTLTPIRFNAPAEITLINLRSE